MVTGTQSDYGDESNIWSGFYNIKERKKLWYEDVTQLPDGFYRCTGWIDENYDNKYDYKQSSYQNYIKDEYNNYVMDDDGNYVKETIIIDPEPLLQDEPRFNDAPDVVIIDKEDSTSYTFNAGWCLKLNGYIYNDETLYPMTFNDPSKLAKGAVMYPMSQSQFSTNELNNAWNKCIEHYVNNKS